MNGLNPGVSKWNMIVWVSVLLNRTIVNSDWRFDHLCGSHLQSQRKDDYNTNCLNISHCHRQPYSGLHSPR